MNAYETPVAPLSKPVYDWTLAKRMAAATLLLAIFFGTMFFIHNWKSQSVIRKNMDETYTQQMIRFFFGWNRPYSTE